MLQPSKYPWYLCLAALLTAVSFLFPTASQAGLKLYKAKESEASFESGGKKIKVWQFTPKEGDGPFPGIIVLYGIDCLDELAKTELLYKNVAGKIADSGYVVHMVHYFNCTPLDPKDATALRKSFVDQVPHLKHKPFDASLEKPYRAWMAAVKDGVQFLRADKNVDKDRIGVVGLSMGGFVGTSLVVEHPELKIKGLINAFGGLPPVQHDKVRKEKLKLPPTLIIGAEDDDLVPEWFQRDLFLLLRETGNRAEAHFYGDTGHAFLNKEGKADMALALNEALPAAIRYLNRHVKGPAVEKK